MENPNDLKQRIVRLETNVESLQKTSLSKEEKKQFDTMSQLLFGDQNLGIKSMRDMVNEMYRNWDRAKWFLGVVGITSIGSLVGFILLIRELTGG